MNEFHKLSLQALGLAAIVSIIAFFAALLSRGDDILGYAAGSFMLSAWSCVQSIWWRVGEIQHKRIDENGRYMSSSAKTWMSVLRWAHLWSFFIGMLLVAAAMFCVK